MNTAPNSEVRAYFATPGPLTDLTAYSSRLRELPVALRDLCGVVQGLVVHPFLAHLYGLAPAALRHDELEVPGGVRDGQSCARALRAANQ